MYTGSVQGGGMDTGGVKFFYFVIKIDQSQATKSHMLNRSLRLTNHK